jgi:hypothetical protein
VQRPVERIDSPAQLLGTRHWAEPAGADACRQAGDRPVRIKGRAVIL